MIDTIRKTSVSLKGFYIVTIIGGIFMAIVLDTQLLEGLQQAIKKANETNTSVLFSKVVKMHALSPLSFYKIGKEQFQGERLFWQEPIDKISIVGLGKVDILRTDSDKHRFESIELAWEKLLENSFIQTEEKLPATGPILFGGFSFDYEKSHSILWELFGDNFFYVPQYMLTNCNNGTYFTTNIICTPNGNIKKFLDVIERGETLRNSTFKMNEYENELLYMDEKEAEQWKQQVANAVSKMQSSHIDKIVLARELRLKFKHAISCEMVLDKLLKEQQTSYVFSLEIDNDCFIGASPERLVKKEQNEVLSTCLAGSIARGSTEEEDDELGTTLLHDPKNLIEHQYVVQSIRKTFLDECIEVNVPNEPVLMKTKHIQHLYTPVRAKCEEGKSILHLVAKLHPTPALGGLPKQDAVRWIRENESLQRGFYGAPIGWTDAYGNGEFAVALRSALIQVNEASLFAGCGIVEDSIPEEEYKETWIKFKPMLNALGGV